MSLTGGGALGGESLPWDGSKVGLRGTCNYKVMLSGFFLPQKKGEGWIQNDGCTVLCLDIYI